MSQSHLAEKTDKNRYKRLWIAIIENARLHAAAEKLPRPSQASAAKDLGVDAAAISRVVSGNELSQNQALLLRTAQYFKASDSQMRGLLALAGALNAEQINQPELAKLYREMFRPLFEEDDFAAEINTLKNIAFHALLEIGIPRIQALGIVEAIDEGNENVEAVKGIILTKLASATDGASASALKHIRDLVTFAQTFQKIVGIDFDVPWSGPLTQVVKRQMRNQPGLKLGSWTRIPNIAITSLKLEPNHTVTDRRHRGFEFLILTSGSGSFEMKPMTQINLNFQGRQGIAYQPTHSHRFTAGRDGAAILVVSYLRADEESRDPIDELIKVAEQRRRPSSPKVRVTSANEGGDHGQQARKIK